MQKPLILVALLLSSPVLAGPGGPKSYDVMVGTAKVPGPFNLTGNCAGCPKGSETGLAPAVYEFLMSAEGSPVREHYAHQVQYTLGEIKGAAKNNNTSKNPLLQPMYAGDLEYMLETEAEFLKAQSGASDRDGLLAATRDGVLLGRASGRMTTAAANEALAKKGRAMWLWGAKWEEKDGAYITPTIAGIMMTALIPDADAKTVAVHYFNAKLNTTPSAVWDLSAVAGAFDASANVSYEDVVAGAKKVQ